MPLFRTLPFVRILLYLDYHDCTIQAKAVPRLYGALCALCCVLLVATNGRLETLRTSRVTSRAALSCLSSSLADTMPWCRDPPYSLRSNGIIMNKASQSNTPLSTCHNCQVMAAHAKNPITAVGTTLSLAIVALLFVLAGLSTATPANTSFASWTSGMPRNRESFRFTCSALMANMR